MLGCSSIVLSCLTALSAASTDSSPGRSEVQKVTVMEDEHREAVQNDTSSVLMDFGDKHQEWRIINDGVMGGKSSSSFRVVKKVAFFEGTVSLENRGGFASARSQPRDHDLSGFQGLLLRVRGDGKRYAFRLRTTEAFDGISYEARFKTAAKEWRIVRIPFQAFRPVFRGRVVQDAEPLDLKSVKTFGFLISDKQAGSFHLEVDWINGYTIDLKE